MYEKSVIYAINDLLYINHFPSPLEWCSQHMILNEKADAACLLAHAHDRIVALTHTNVRKGMTVDSK
jgi:hypothetical protein